MNGVNKITLSEIYGEIGIGHKIGGKIVEHSFWWIKI